MNVLKLPAFAAALLFMYWSVPIFCLTGRIRFLTSLRIKRDDMLSWSQGMVAFFRATLHHVGEGRLYRTSNPVLYLSNHRSWADFFLDVYTTEGRSALLSRWAVFATFPVFLAAAALIKGIIFFKRNVAIDKTAFNAMLDARIKGSPRSGLLVYPEGHRNLRPTPLPLKRGMLHYAYSRKMPVQVVITSGKELLLSETKLSAGWGAQLKVGYSKVIASTEHADFDSFVQQVQTVWDSTWTFVHAAETLGPELTPSTDHGDISVDMPLDMKIQQTVFCLNAILLLLFTLYLSLRVFLWFGPLARCLCLGLTAVTAASLHKAQLEPPAPKAS